jgi:uncharacterized protein (TIGR03435 family)
MRHLLAAVMAVVLCIVVSGFAVTTAQQAATAKETKPPRFEVATVKPNASGTADSGSVFQSDRYRAFNSTLRQLVAEAYRVRSLQVIGGPPWVSSDRFDIEAKAEDPATLALVPQPNGTRTMPGTAFLMLRELLAERFKVVAHRETREGPIYALVMARSDRGPGLRPPAVNCAAIDPLNPPPGVGMCGGIGRAVGRLMARTATMAQLATSLSITVQRTVVDRTGLAGAFDFDLEWKPIDPNADATNATSVNEFAPSLAVALEEQLGVKLDSRRGPVDYIVIDSADRPPDN